MSVMAGNTTFRLYNHVIYLLHRAALHMLSKGLSLSLASRGCCWRMHFRQGVHLLPHPGPTPQSLSQLPCCPTKRRTHRLLVAFGNAYREPAERRTSFVILAQTTSNDEALFLVFFRPLLHSSTMSQMIPDIHGFGFFQCQRECTFNGLFY